MSRPLVLLAVLMAVLCHGQAPAAAPAMKLGALPPWDTSASAPLRPLPAGCRPIEYVGANATQYVDTGVFAGPETRMEVDIAVTNWLASTYSLCGVSASTGRNAFGKGYSGAISGSANSAKLYFGLGAQNYPSSILLRNIEGERHVFFVDATTRKAGMDSTVFSLTSAGNITTNPITSQLLAQRTSASNVRGHMAARLYGARFYQSGVLVRDYLPVKDANGVAGLWDRVSGQIYYSATATPLVAGPLVVDPDAEPAALLPKNRNWYAPWLLATNPPTSTAPGNAFAFDALVLPEGLYATRRSASEIVVAERPMIEAMVQRYRTGLAPTNLPVNIGHASTNVVGRITRLWHVAESGLWARLEMPKTACSGKPFLSAEVLCLKATASDDWGAWGTFELPWTLRGVALTADPALSGTRYRLLDYVPSASGAYPDPRTVNDTWNPHR